MLSADVATGDSFLNEFVREERDPRDRRPDESAWERSNARSKELSDLNRWSFDMLWNNSVFMVVCLVGLWQTNRVWEQITLLPRCSLWEQKRKWKIGQSTSGKDPDVTTYSFEF